MTPRETLDAMLGYLDFVAQIEEQERDGAPVLQVFTNEADRLIGNRGERLDDIQFLLNRILQSKNRDAQRIIVDVEHYRAMRDDALIERVRHLSVAVINSGHSVQTDPLNSYERRVVHNAFKEDPQVETWSPPDDARLKRITLRPRRQPISEKQAASESQPTA